MPSSTMVAISFGWIMSTLTSQTMNNIASTAKCQYFNRFLNIDTFYIESRMRANENALSGSQFSCCKSQYP